MVRSQVLPLFGSGVRQDERRKGSAGGGRSRAFHFWRRMSQLVLLLQERGGVERGWCGSCGLISASLFPTFLRILLPG